MKKLLLLITVAFCSCVEPAKTQEHTNSAKRIDITWKDENGGTSEEEFTIIIVDSCEYLISGFDRSRTVTHKGNCKFCRTRK